MYTFLLLFIFIQSSRCGFEVPDALVEVLHPRGLRVSIPDQEGIKLFAFHGQLNQEMNGREGGTFSRDVTKAKNGRWTFYDPYAEVKVGDVLYYWTYVDYFDGRNKLGYTKDDQQYTVTQLIDKDGPKTPNRNPDPQACAASATTVKSLQKVCAGQLIFEDNFDDLKNWSPEIKFAGSPDFEFVVYTNKPEVIRIDDGKLKVRPTPSEQLFGQGFVTTDRTVDLGSNCTGALGSLDCAQKAEAFLILPPVASAQISTKNVWSFTYGKVEIRAKLPKGNWIYPQLFLSPLKEEYGPGYESGQIRVAFVGGTADSEKTLQGGCILGGTKGGRNWGMKTIKKNDGSWCNDFHNFTVLWKPDQITLSVDGTVYGNVFAPDGGFISEALNLNLVNVERWRSGSKFAPFDKEMSLVIGVGVGGHCFEDRDDGTKPWVNNEAKGQKKFYSAQKKWLPTWSDESVLEVDYVKVWAL